MSKDIRHHAYTIFVDVSFDVSENFDSRSMVERWHETKVKREMQKTITLQMFLRAIEIANANASCNDRKTQKSIRQQLRKNAQLMRHHNKNDRWNANTKTIRDFIMSLRDMKSYDAPSSDHIAQAYDELK